MFGRNLTTIAKILLALSFLLLTADEALAYVGPGADVTFISQFVALLWLMGAACSSILLWPIYALIRKVRGGNSTTKVEEQQQIDEPRP